METGEFVLLPGKGVVLPRGVGLLAVPMSELDQAVTPPPDEGSVVFHRPWEPRPDYVTEVTLTDGSQNRHS